MQLDTFELAGRFDLQTLAAEFAGTGRVRLERVLPAEAAAALLAECKRRADWVHVVAANGGAAELTRTMRASLPVERVAALDAAIRAEARYGFQYRYETIRVPDQAAERMASGDPFAKLARALSTEPVLATLRRITGVHDLAFADAQATAYGPGDFLTGHNDEVEGKERRAAYVLGLSPHWRPDWGGLLLFHGPEGRLDGWAPQANSLTLFRVPSLHSVSEVVAQVPARRYSITGWLRAGPVP